MFKNLVNLFKKDNRELFQETPKSGDYRILTNGVSYKVQRYCGGPFGWETKVTYKEIEQAQQFIKEAQIKELPLIEVKPGA